MNTLSGIQSVILNKNPKRLPPTTPTALGGSLNPGTNGEVLVIHALNATNVYVGGKFTTVDGIGVNYIAKWNGTSWTNINSPATGPVYAIHALNETNVYFAGSYFSINNINTSLARWDGTNWSAVGGTFPDRVFALYAFSQTNIYAGGGFFTYYTTWVNKIARWNGTTWVDLRGGIGGGTIFIMSIAALNANWIYVCGKFQNAGNAINANNIAIWDGSNFYKMGDGIPIPLYVNQYLNTIFVLDGNNVYVGGQFAYGGANNIIRWDGSQWQTMGSGLDGEVKGIYAFSPTNVYAVGWFPWGVARWDGMTWNVVGPGVTGVGQYGTDFRVNTISATSPNNIYIGGLFTSSDGVTVNNILRLS